MQPGPELDAEIARKVLSVIVIVDTETGNYQLRDVDNRRFVPVPPYSTDTMTANTLLSDYKSKGCTFKVSSHEDGSWTVTINHPQIQGVNISSSGVSLPHAICQAILQFNSLFKLVR